MKAVEKSATSVVEILQDQGHIAYFAGGWVRDFLLQHPSDDIDIATSASPEEIIQLFPKTIPVGIAFGIVIVVHENHHFEVATFRKEKEYVDGRRPSHIEKASPQEDALRRDFTINGMFYDPLARKLYDFCEGQKDLAEKRVRAIGNPSLRFQEDRLRMIRAVRYATRFQFTIEKTTELAILQHAPDLFPSVAIERVVQEFKKMSHFAHFDKALILLHQLHLLPVIFKELKHLSLHTLEKRLTPISDYPAGTPTIIPLLALFDNYTPTQSLELAQFLKVSSEEKEWMMFFEHLKTLSQMPLAWQDELEPIEWVKLYADPRIDLALKIVEAHLVPLAREAFAKHHLKRKEKLKRSIHCYKTKSPPLNASHLLQLGFQEGKYLGELLKEAEKISARKQLFDVEQLLSELKNTPLWKPPKK